MSELVPDWTDDDDVRRWERRFYEGNWTELVLGEIDEIDDPGSDGGSPGPEFGPDCMSVRFDGPQSVDATLDLIDNVIDEFEGGSSARPDSLDVTILYYFDDRRNQHHWVYLPVCSDIY